LEQQKEEILAKLLAEGRQRLRDTVKKSCSVCSPQLSVEPLDTRGQAAVRGERNAPAHRLE
jgi:hypothetical protein